MCPKLRLVTLVWLLCSFRVSAQQQTMPFANEVAAFKHQDSLSMPKPGGILFIGSSSIRLWTDLQQRFTGKSIIQRGVGGSELWQWVKYYCPDLVYSYRPKKVFVYVGENDLASGRTAQTFYSDFVTLYGMISSHLPKAEIYFLSIKQSPSRIKTYSQVLAADSLVAAFLKGKKHSRYIDVNTVLYNAHGQPDSALFKSDMLHLNSKGYDRWQQALKKYVK